MTTTLTMARRGEPLADPAAQRALLEGAPVKPFALAMAESGLGPLTCGPIEVLQVNVGKLCNQTCRHCHVDAGPDRREVMTRETMAACLRAMECGDIPTLDVTGGAPEMNPDFRWLVDQARARGRHVIDRCNLTILVTPGYADLPEFLASRRVEVVASLPCYGPENTDRQRGGGVFARSIEALRRLNAVGYGSPGGPGLTLVYNPIGAKLPPEQAGLEAAYRRELLERFGVTFDSLITITNMPISRFLEDLVTSGGYESYMRLLAESFNPAAAAGVMCRGMLSVGWDGALYDCDFNQMLGIGVLPGLPRTIREFEAGGLSPRAVATGRHCYGCSAGRGSGCRGAVVSG